MSAATDAAELAAEEWFATEGNAWVLLPARDSYGPFSDPPLYSATRNHRSGGVRNQSSHSLAGLRKACESHDLREANVPLRPGIDTNRGI